MDRIFYKEFGIPDHINNQIWSYCIASKMNHIARNKKELHTQLLNLTKGIYYGLELGHDTIKSCTGNGETYIHWYTINSVNDLSNNITETFLDNVIREVLEIINMETFHSPFLAMLLHYENYCGCIISTLDEEPCLLPQYISRIYGNTKGFTKSDNEVIKLFIDKVVGYHNVTKNMK